VEFAMVTFVSVAVFGVALFAMWMWVGHKRRYPTAKKTPRKG
jgi:hypothetical protein